MAVANYKQIDYLITFESDGVSFNGVNALI